MSIALTNRRRTMLKKILVIAATLGFSGAALAHPPHWAPAHGYRAHYVAPRPVFVAQPVYVAPRPVYVVPAPRVVYAAPPRPIAYPVYPAPAYGSPSVSIRLNLPL
jgi:hypothetical protein